MKNKSVYLYGAGGHAKVIRDILEECDITVKGISDDNPATTQFMEMEVMYGPKSGEEYIVSIGNCGIRRKIAEKLADEGCTFATAIHPSAIISKHATVEEGSVVMQGAIVQSGAKIGRHCIVNTAATVDHDCNIGDYVHIAPGVTICGDVTIGEGCWVGAGSVVIQGVKIGRGSFIGAGSVVCKDIPEGVVAYGNPCKVKRDI
jgi:sugar O-acyltransferase (sialic acid O-acetyltransferase NeuD family)